MIDTNVVSFLMQRRPDALERLSQRRPGDVILTSPVAAEIQFGIQRLADGSRRRQLLSAQYVHLRSTLRWSDWTEAAADEFGRQKAHLETAGTLIEDMDIAIGSLAISLDAMLATYDAHMGRLNGLVIDDWSH